MFETLSHYALQQYWWILVSILAALLVFLMFVQGGQTLIYKLGKTSDERTLLINSLGRKWEFTFTTLVTFGGAFFASFPLFYATSFGGAYWVWILILFSFVIQAVAYEFRSKPGNFLGPRTYETFLFINGALGTILIGTAVATFFTGSMFHVDQNNFSEWMSPYRGLELAFDFGRYETFINLSLGIAVFFLARTLAILYFMNNVDENNILKRCRKQILFNGIPFLVFFVFFLVNILIRQGFAYDPETGMVMMEPYKYLMNILDMPVVAFILLAGIGLVTLGIFRAYFRFEGCRRKAIWGTSIGTIAAVFGLFCLAGLNNTAFYPSVYDMQSSLTIRNASSSHYTLSAMSYVSLLIPFVLAYIWYAWRSINKKQISKEEMHQEDSHIY
jgi:cytochrome d ubiquinol oxidase subunit II